MKPFYRFLIYVILASGAWILLTYANNLRTIAIYLIVTSCIAGYIDWKMDRDRVNRIIKRYYEKYPEECAPQKPNIILDKFKSFLKAIWGNIWPTESYRANRFISKQNPEFSPDNFLRECRDIPENELLRKPPATYEECYKPEKPIRGNLAWEQDGIKFVPDKDGKYTKHLIGENIHYVKYIPEFDDNYVMGCDPFNPNNKSRGSYKADILEHYARYWKEGIGYLPDFLKPQPLSGDVSEQSVILPKMDEIIHRTECEELLLEYDKCKNRHTAMAFYNHLIGK